MNFLKQSSKVKSRDEIKKLKKKEEGFGFLLCSLPVLHVEAFAILTHLTRLAGCPLTRRPVISLGYGPGGCSLVARQKKTKDREISQKQQARACCFSREARKRMKKSAIFRILVEISR